MKKQIFSFIISTLFISMAFIACKKETADDNTATSTEISKHSEDQSRVSGEVDAVINDANEAIETSSFFTGRTERSQSFLCNASVVYDTVSNPRTITITYNGADCFGNVTRTGIVRLSMAQGVHWKDAGAVITVNYINLHITRLSDNKSITLNGTQAFTNVSGGLMFNLATLQSITHSITSSGMTITFDDNSQRVWQIAKQRVFSYDNGIIVTSTGTHSDGTHDHIAEWGVNRFGHAFVSATTQLMVIEQDCDFRLTQGQITHYTGGITAVGTFGLDANGTATGCPGTGHYYCKIIWTGPNGNSYTVIFPY